MIKLDLVVLQARLARRSGLILAAPIPKWGGWQRMGKCGGSRLTTPVKGDPEPFLHELKAQVENLLQIGPALGVGLSTINFLSDDMRSSLFNRTALRWRVSICRLAGWVWTSLLRPNRT